jgi:hypothetical protein
MASKSLRLPNKNPANSAILGTPVSPKKVLKMPKYESPEVKAAKIDPSKSAMVKFYSDTEDLTKSIVLNDELPSVNVKVFACETHPTGTINRIVYKGSE